MITLKAYDFSATEIGVYEMDEERMWKIVRHPETAARFWRKDKLDVRSFRIISTYAPDMVYKRFTVTYDAVPVSDCSNGEMEPTSFEVWAHDLHRALRATYVAEEPWNNDLTSSYIEVAEDVNGLP